MIPIRKATLEIFMVRDESKDDEITQLLYDHIDCLMSKLIELKVEPAIVSTLNESEEIEEDEPI